MKLNFKILRIVQMNLTLKNFVLFFTSGFSGVGVTPGEGRVNYFSWFNQLGLVLGGVFLALALGVAPPTGVQEVLWFVPLGGALVYGVLFGLAGVNPARAGGVAWWISLVGLFLVGGASLGHPPGGATLAGGLLLDSLGLPYVFLTVSLLPLVVLASLDSIRQNQVTYYFWVLFLGGILVLCFCVEDFLVFYILFEILGFPMFLLIGQHGPRGQRVSAAYKFFVYTFGGSAFILPVLVYLHWGVGSTGVTTLVGYQFTEYEQALFFGLCSLPFGVKIPVVPLHLWLPEAHVEAPTPISMLLAGLLLKTGGYAFLRFLIPVFPHGLYVWGPFLTGVGLFSILFGSLYALVQVDMKRIIAYASVAHISVVFLGILTATPGGAQGATYLMLAHGYTSAGLFAGIGVLYDRYHTRTVRAYGGLAGMMPLAGVTFFILTLGNLSFPFTGGFTGEFMILAELGRSNLVVCFLAGGTVFLSLAYSVWLFNRLWWGPVSSGVTGHTDLTPTEVGVLGWTTVGCLVLGWGGSTFVEWTHECYVQLAWTFLGG